MLLSDVEYILKWFIYLLIFSVAFLPLTFSIFSNFKDKGYIFSKIIGLVFVSYAIFVLGVLKLIPFNTISTYFILIIFILVNYFFEFKFNSFKHFVTKLKQSIKLIIFEEIVFLIGLFIWSYIRANNPDIFGLEKYMDLGFLNSILRSEYFPPKDMWFSPLPINYYYFGHLITAVLTKFSQIPSFISYNLMIATIFSLTFASAFSIGLNLLNKHKLNIIPKLAGLITALILAFGGNLTTIYTFFKVYDSNMPPPFFLNLPFLPLNFPNDYWYPNATRFIPFTIHEFPVYSFVVSDLHGHVLDIPVVLLFIAILANTFINSSNKIKNNFIKFKFFKDLIISLPKSVLISFILAIMYMTNAWDGLIYLVLSSFVILRLGRFINKNWVKSIFLTFKNLIIIGIGFLLFSFPFSINFKPFVSGIGIICAPKILTDIQKIGPFLFEANHCQRSPVWELILLYGFFYFFVVLFLLFIKYKKGYKLSRSDEFILIITFLSTLLIIIPEFIYIKDIYPLHYRANTMFKLSYQSFMMLSISSGFIFINLLTTIKTKLNKFVFVVITIPFFFLIFIYPKFAINSYYNNLQNYSSLDGLKYMQKTYPQDYQLINWINKNIVGQPVILEANGDSYTEYARISTNTGLPTVIGWPVHEWLWRGTYDVVSPRVEDVKTIYTTSDLNITKTLINKYNISYIVVSTLEEKKYPNINIRKFNYLGKIIYSNGPVILYKVNY